MSIMSFKSAPRCILCTFETNFSMQASLSSSIMGILLWFARAILAPNWPSMHVRPSTNTSCHTHPCHTLLEYVKQYFNDPNLTQQFLPGNHTLDVNIAITNIHQLELLGNFSAVVSTMIICSSKVGFSFRHISKVRIDCSTFVLCSRSH